MRLPMDSRVFIEFIEESDIFRLTREAIKQCLKNWYNDGREQFVDDISFNFDRSGISYRKFVENMDVFLL